jgi:hypothetical protein
VSIHYRHRVLLVGGQSEFIARKVIPRLATLLAPDGAPVSVPRHVPWKTDRFPTAFVGMDSVMVVTDMVSHTLSNAARDHAKRCAVPYIPISRKWLESAASLTRYGYRVAPPEASAPPVAAPVEAAPATPAPEVPEMPLSKNHIPRKDTLRILIEALAADPAATNAALAAKHGDRVRPVLPEARKRLGIHAPRHGGNRAVLLAPVQFVATCAEYGVSDDVACASLARFAHGEEVPAPNPEEKPRPEGWWDNENEGAPPRFPRKAAPAPAPVPVATPVRATPTPLDTLREAVALLRVAMADADVVSLSIDREGNVVAERMTVTTVRL